MILGISGTNSSGKDTVAKYIEGKGFFHISLSDILRDEMRKRNIESNRDNMISFANKLEAEKGSGALVKMTIKEYGNKDKLVISSIRKPPEVDYLHTIPDFKLIFVDVPIKIRYDRMLLRARESEEIMSFEEFKTQQEKEVSGANTQNLIYCQEKADFILENNGKLDDLYQKVDRLIEKEAKLS
jgi:dephospho-CoA kinase